MIQRLIDGWRARRFVKDRERLLQSDNPVLAFAGNPAAGTQLLRPGETNDAAFALLKNGDVPLIRIHDGVELPAKPAGRPPLYTQNCRPRCRSRAARATSKPIGPAHQMSMAASSAST